MVPMHTPFAPRESLARWMAAGLWGLLAGSACQMLQARLWDWEPYAGMVVLAMGVVWWLLRRPGGRAGRFLVLLLAGSVAAFGMTGLRAVLFQSQGLDPVLEGRDIRVTGVVTAMPQWSDAGARFRLSVESALLDDRAVRLPPGVSLGWYTGNPGPSADGAALELQRQPVPLQAGERWQMTVRLKAHTATATRMASTTNCGCGGRACRPPVMCVLAPPTGQPCAWARPGAIRWNWRARACVTAFWRTSMTGARRA